MQPNASLVMLALLVIATSLALALDQTRMLTVRPSVNLPITRQESSLLLDGVHAVERDARGSFRWSTGDARLAFDVPGQAETILVGLWLGPTMPAHARARLQMSAWERPLANIEIGDRPRQYTFAVPWQAVRAGRLSLQFKSDTTIIPPDPRSVGLRMEGITLRMQRSTPVTPTLPLAGVQLLLLALGAALLCRLAVPTAPSAVATILAGLALALAYHSLGPFVYAIYIRRALATLGLLALLTYGMLPLAGRWCATIAAPRLLRALWLAALLACAIRLVGALYPLFSAYDIALNTDRLLSTVRGDLLQTNESFEFQGGVTVYPPGPYLLLLPGLLLDLPPRLLIQAGIALIDGFGALLIGLFARALGAGARTALFAAVLYAAIPISLTSLYYGHTAQIFGQWLMAPLATLLMLALREQQGRLWLAAGMLLSMALLSHIGVAILAVAWLGLAWLALRPRAVVPARAWRRLTAMLALSCLVGAVFVYAPVALLHLHELQKVSQPGQPHATGPHYNLIAGAFLIAYHRLGVLLAVLGLALVRPQRLLPGAAALVGAWCAAAALFWAVELYSGLQVRYLVFFTPLACVLIALSLDRIAGLGKLAHGLAWAVLLLLLVQGSAVWYTGAFYNIAPSMIPLLR